MKGLKAEELNNCLHLLDTRSPIYQKFSKQQLMTSLPEHRTAQPIRKEPVISSFKQGCSFYSLALRRPPDRLAGLWDSPAPTPPNFAFSSLCSTDRVLSQLTPLLFHAHLQLLIPVFRSDAQKPSGRLLQQGF